MLGIFMLPALTDLHTESQDSLNLCLDGMHAYMRTQNNSNPNSMIYFVCDSLSKNCQIYLPTSTLPRFFITY